MRLDLLTPVTRVGPEGRVVSSDPVSPTSLWMVSSGLEAV